MRNKLIEGVEAGHVRETPFVFEIGNTVSVGVRITEGAKTRVQPFVGVVIARRGSGTNETFTVRRIVNNEGGERIFPLHSPNLVSVEVQRRGKIRRSKLYFLRDRVGRARRLRERRVSGKSGRGKNASRATGRRGGAAGDGVGSRPADSGNVATPEGQEVAAGV